MDNKDITDTMKKQPSLIVSMIPIISALALLLMSLIKYHIDIQIPLIIASIIAGFISVVVLKNQWEDVEKGIMESIMNAMQAILICCIIGLIIGSWIAGGIVPSIIYYGLKILSPKFFLVTCLLVCSVVSIATGSSWTTCGTMGVAMIGIGTGMGITAGAVVSGAYFGDKMSPFSDTTNLAPAMAGTTLFAHIRHMVYTTSVSYIISIIVFTIINLKFVTTGSNEETVYEITQALSGAFTISPLLLLPVIIVIGMIAFKIPAIPGLLLSVVFGVICAVTVQGFGMVDIGNILEYGFKSNTGNVMIDELLTRGGLQNMMWTVSLILCALTFGGIMYSSGMLEAIAISILKIAKGRGGLVTATILTAIAINIICGEQYLSILITGKMYREEYKRQGLAPQNLSRCLEDAGTITSPIIPWTTCATAISGYLGVTTVAYFPYAILCLVNPIVSIIFGFTGFTMKKIEDVNPEDIIDID